MVPGRDFDRQTLTVIKVSAVKTSRFSRIQHAAEEKVGVFAADHMQAAIWTARLAVASLCIVLIVLIARYGSWYAHNYGLRTERKIAVIGIYGLIIWSCTRLIPWSENWVRQVGRAERDRRWRIEQRYEPVLVLRFQILQTCLVHLIRMLLGKMGYMVWFLTSSISIWLVSRTSGWQFWLGTGLFAMDALALLLFISIHIPAPQVFAAQEKSNLK